MMTKKLMATPLLLALLAGCATQPPKNETLTQAREAVTEAEENPAVSRHAPIALREAQETLQRAENAWRSGDDKAQAEHLSYLALKRAQLAQALARREMVVRAGNEAAQQRQQILLQSRDQQAQAARREAEQARQQLAQAQEEAEQARREALQYQSELEAQQAQLKDAQAKLSELEPTQTERGIVLTLDEVLFPFNSAELKAGTQRTMDRLAQYLRDNPDYQILIEGHTDSVGDEGYNQRLSERRADAVRSALAQRGIEGDRLRTLGLGETFPIADNSSNPGRAENRRVEVVIAEGQMPPTREEVTRPTIARDRQPAPQAGQPTQQPQG